MLRFFGIGGFVCAQFAQKALTAQAQDLLLLGITEALPVKTLLPAAHTAATETPLVRLANPPAWALDRKELQLFSHTTLPKPLNTLK
ncbi:hypothetical protein APT61_12655 [Leclercia adecarboxylata]|nr:hypothetical protein APT61_12655 [Leclercia adecarboxylata]